MAETSVFFGTAFPQQTERDKRLGATDAGQFLPAWKQEARDEQGRRRFHGAFTGGFSAGYFNTVGSKEGWTPSQFVSSRSSRREQKAARVEDFMDEEDLQALASTKRLVTTDEFDTLAGTEKEIEKRRQQQLDEDTKRRGGGGGDMTFLTSSLMNLVAPTQDSTGMRLLRKMGWRIGQGVGPRTAFVKDDDDQDDGDSSNLQQQMTLAPKDTPIVDYQPKTNTFGLGYDLVTNVPQVAEMRRFQQQQQDQQHEQKTRGGGSGFGLGVFDDDEEDIMLYDDEKQPGLDRKYHHTLYDDNESALSTTGIKKRKQSMSTTSGDHTIKKARCSDGHLPLKGFHLSTQPQELGKWYPPPTVPANFDEMHNTQRSIGKNATPRKEQSSSITIDARGAMLGEKPIEARSVFDYMTSKSKERLAQATTSTTTTTSPIVDQTRLQVTLVPKDVAQLALRGFIPFGDTPEKQTRYRHFLEKALVQPPTTNNNESTPTNANTTTFDIPIGMTHEAGMKELDDFTKAARIFRPISSMMSGRFTTSTLPPTGPTGSTNVEYTSFEGGLKTEEQWKKEKEIREKQVIEEPKAKLSQEAEAAAMNMFGPMTRTQHVFYPNRLLCKRFNVRNPHPDHVPQGPGHRTQAGSTSALGEKAMASMFSPPPQPSPPKLTLTDTQQDDPALRAVIAKPSSRLDENSTTPSSATEEEKEKDNGDKELDYKRPTMDIFKAIFETSDDDESDDDDKINDEAALSTQNTTKNTQQQQTSPPPILSTNRDDEDDFIGPPVPMITTTTTSPPPAATEKMPFRPVFTKRASQDTTKVHSDQVIVAPFQSRFSSSSSSDKRRPQRRRISVSSASSSSSENSDIDKKDLERKRRRKSSTHTSSSSSSKKKKKDDNKKKKEKRKHHHRRQRTASTSKTENEDRHRHHHQRSREDDQGSDSKQKKEKEENVSLWVEKKSVPRRSRAEDLW